ncbi:MAG: hypothetical protein R3F14_01865 [Polyangiaceae bacterium]
MKAQNPKAPVSALDLHIGELQIEGLSPSARFDVARGLETELIRLCTEQGVPAGLVAGRGELPPIVLPAASPAAPLDLGRSVARALYEGWR